MKIKTRLLLSLICVLLIGTIPSTATAKDRDTYISEEYQNYCVEIGEKYCICPEILMAIIEAESSGKKNAANGPCSGLMQVDSRYAGGYLEQIGKTDYWDPETNIEIGALILLKKASLCSGEIDVALAMYHGESDWREKQETGKTSDYVQKILDRAWEFERIHNK